MHLGYESILHLNLGIVSNKKDTWEHEIIYGLRADIQLIDEIYILSELFAINFELPGFQFGLRTILIDELLEADITWGKGFEKGITEPGFNVGIAYTPARIW